MCFASFAWLILIIGYTQRFHKNRHVPLMIAGILMDFGLVGYLELTKHAVETALEFKLSLLQQLHIASSSVALILYFPTLWLGFALVRGQLQHKTAHIRVAKLALLFRTIGFILMFSMWKTPQDLASEPVDSNTPPVAIQQTNTK